MVADLIELSKLDPDDEPDEDNRGSESVLVVDDLKDARELIAS